MPCPITRVQAFDKTRYRKYIGFDKSFGPVHRLKQLPNTTNETWNGKGRKKRKERLWGKDEKPGNLIWKSQSFNSENVQPSKKETSPLSKQSTTQPKKAAPITPSKPLDVETPTGDGSYTPENAVETS